MLSMSHELAAGLSGKDPKARVRTGFYCKDLAGHTFRDRDKYFWVAGFPMLEMWAHYCGRMELEFS